MSPLHCLPLHVSSDASLNSSTTKLLQVFDTFPWSSFEEKLIDGDRQRVLADFRHYLVTDGEEKPSSRIAFPKNTMNDRTRVLFTVVARMDEVEWAKSKNA
ncbi:hypothetical protein OUZ56_019705 [Daphnia magna]|uniref:Uncharacterized protein n=1 Tax=Daphnia magna TaxID=35525 RepID=A0ABQ9ZCD0_9CRUS|nr:hypothetical protein OUZ56_019705 [Daphnia magna]